MTLVSVRYTGSETLLAVGEIWEPGDVREVKLSVAKVLVKRRGTDKFNIVEPEDAAAKALEPQEVDDYE